MNNIFSHIKKYISRIYSRIVSFFGIVPRKQKTIFHIINKYKTIDYHAPINVEYTMDEYSKWLLSLIMESKTFNTIFITYLNTFVYPKIQETIYQAHNVQKRLLQYLLQKAKDTHIGKSYGFQSYGQDPYHDFQKHVPVVIYDEYKNWIELAKQEPDILWPGKINKFSASAGTTSRKKHIPVTDEALESTNKAGFDMFATYAKKHPDTQIFGAYARPLGGTIQEQLENETIIGDVSALLVLERSSLLQKKYMYPLEMLLEPNRYVKRDTFLKNLRPHEHCMMLGVTSRIHEMIQYIKKKDEKHFATFIKNLDLIIRWGVSAKPYIQYFNELWLNHIWVYNASEWYFGYQDVVNYENDQAQAPYQLLVNHGIFYEFIPFDTENFEWWMIKKHAKVKPLREISSQDIKQKTKFALVITTNGGLRRYMIGDVIRFVDNEYRFEIVGRTKECINLKGEELMEDHVNKVLQDINNTCNTKFSYYTIGPDHENNPSSHERVLEGEISKWYTQETITKKIDFLLQQVNADYEAKRKDDMLLKMPIVHIVPEGTFTQRLKDKKKLWWQTKIPKLSSERNNINELLSIANSSAP